MTPQFAELAARLSGPLYLPGDEGYAPEAAAFNTATIHTPDAVAAVEFAADIVEAVKFARENDYKITVQATGHGAESPITSGLLISTHRLNNVTIDPSTRIATIGAGVRWGAVIAEAAKYGLAPITGSSPNVGAVGYILGGGLGPLARSHGFSSDYLVSLTVVTGEGDLLEANAITNPDLFWALRGGKDGLGIVTQINVRLIELSVLYGGSLFFDEDNIEPALRAWVDWTPTADPLVSTSVAIYNFPDLNVLPPPLRGRRLLNLRFAYPGDLAKGAELAAPLRAIAPIYMDNLGELPVDKMARIHNDPTMPGPSWVRGMMLTHIDQSFATAVLNIVGKGTNAPFIALEIRHLGEATRRDMPESSAVGGRDASFTLGIIANNPEHFASTAPTAADNLVHAMTPWLSEETNINFRGNPSLTTPAVRNFPPATQSRLEHIRHRYDPSGILS